MFGTQRTSDKTIISRRRGTRSDDPHDQVRKYFSMSKCILINGRERMEAKSRCIKTLDYAMSGPEGAPVCDAFVEALGLKTIFTVFMGKVWDFLYGSLSV